MTPNAEEIMRIFCVGSSVYEKNYASFLKNFTHSLENVYGVCPTPLCRSSLDLFLKTKIDGRDSSAESQLIANWKGLLQKHHPRVYDKFNETYEDMARKHRETEEQQRAKAREREAREREERIESCRKYWQCKRRSDGEWPEANGYHLT
jgi:uncharacterized protein YukE